MDRQMSIDDLLIREEKKEEITLPEASGERVYRIPDDVWENRCRYCVHKHAEKNAAIPMDVVYKQMYAHLVPCRIMTVAHPNDKQGECMSFAPRMETYGICGTCENNNYFHKGYCTKEDHAPQRRVFWGNDLGGSDYYGRHVLSTCDDYEPNKWTKANKGE